MTPAVAVVVVSAAAVLAACSTDPTIAAVGVEAVGCRPFPERGSGMFVDVDLADGPLVLTAAHVVAGAERITVTNGDVEVDAIVVAFDPAMDLAYLAVDGEDTDGRDARLESPAIDAEEDGVAHVVRDGVPLEIPVTVRRRLDIRTEDVYVEGETVRPGYEISAAIEEGDSGGAVVVDGRVIGVLWARSRSSDGRAYAIDPVRAGATIDEQLATGDLSAVDLTRC